MSATEPIADRPAQTVTVVIPTYNYAHFLPQAVDSALHQSHPATEVLVIDDGSTDDTGKTVSARYNLNPKVRYIYQPNSGLSSARNTGLKNAGGEFVAFLDADDEWQPDFLKEVLDRFSRLPPTFAIVATRSTIINRDGSPLPRKQILDEADHELTCADIILKTRFSPSAAVVRRSVFCECGDFDPKLRSSEDRDMWIRIAARHRIFLCGRQLIRFRRHGQSMSHHADRMKRNTRQTFEKARSNDHLPALPLFFWCKVFSFFHFQTAWMYFEEGRRAAALRDLILSIFAWPWFSQTRHLNEPPWFRLRTLKHFFTAKNPRRA